MDSILRIPPPNVDVKKHLEKAIIFEEVCNKTHFKVNEYDEGYSLFHDWGSMILGRPEVKIITTKSKRCVWSQSKGYCKIIK
jgi:hypothetical protein